MISAGYFHWVCLDVLGVVWTYGSNESGQLGAECADSDGTKVNLTDSEIDRVCMIKSGPCYTMALNDAGTLYFWGQPAPEFR